jgi:HPt (histidine-containing phosphotransfer) domain-containing protein
MYKHLSLESLKNLEIIERTLAAQMVQIFLNELPVQMKMIHKSIDEKNVFEFIRRIHSMKGSISVFGCTEICQDLKNIESLAKNSEFKESLDLYSTHKPKIDEFFSEVKNFLAAAKKKSLT